MRVLARVLHCRPGNVAADSIAREEPPCGLVNSPPVAQGFEQLWGEHHIAILAPFTLFDSDDHSLAIDIGDLQADRLRDAQSCSVAGRQDGAMLDARDAA